LKQLSPFYYIPAKTLSHFTGALVYKAPGSLMQKWAIKIFIKLYKINTQEALSTPESFKTLGDFFIRPLKPQSRPIAPSKFVSPADGKLSSGGITGKAKGFEALAAKGCAYSLKDLVGNLWNPSWDLSTHADQEIFYAVVYLAPYNYHRVHAPFDAEWVATERLSGYLWPVNAWHVQQVPGLFTQNERACMHFIIDGESYYLVWVGATNVGSIVLHKDFEGAKGSVFVTKGQELGWFALGSTVILLGPNKGTHNFFVHQKVVKMGQALS